MPIENHPIMTIKKSLALYIIMIGAEIGERSSFWKIDRGGDVRKKVAPGFCGCSRELVLRNLRQEPEVVRFEGVGTVNL